MNFDLALEPSWSSWTRLERNKLGDGLAASRDNDFFSRLDGLEQAGQMGLGFMHADGFHDLV